MRAPSQTLPSRALTKQLEIWLNRLAEARRQNPSEDKALFAFAVKTETNWAAESQYYRELMQLSRRLGAETIDVRNEGAIDTPQEFAQAMVQLVKRLSDDNYVALGQNPTANLVAAQNDEAILPVIAAETPAFLRNAAEQDEADETELSAADIARYQAEGEWLGYSGDALVLYVQAVAENDRWTAGKGGDPARALRLMTLAQNKRDDDLSRPRYVPSNPDDRQ